MSWVWVVSRRHVHLKTRGCMRWDAQGGFDDELFGVLNILRCERASPRVGHPCSADAFQQRADVLGLGSTSRVFVLAVFLCGDFQTNRLENTHTLETIGWRP